MEEGHDGEVKLDGLRMGGVFQWPGAVHEGHGKCQPFIDERADDKPREALIKIMSAPDTDPMATTSAAYFSTLDPVFAPFSAPTPSPPPAPARHPPPTPPPPPHHTP